MTWRDHLRAGIILVALIAHGIYALPLPRKVTDRTLKEDWRQRDIRMWRTWLSNLGLEVEHEQIEEGLMTFTDLTSTVHKTLKTPFEPLFELTGSNQAWALFAAATTQPERLVVEIREDPRTGWRPILRRLDPCCTWMEPTIRYRRIRGIWDGQKKRPRGTYRKLTSWLAAHAFEDFPEATEVRVFLEQGRSVFPWEEPDPTLVQRHVRLHRRNGTGPADR